jgi:preprotein translocase subunit SecE
MATQQEGKPGIFTRVSRYLRDMRGELKKVVWPSKKQVINNTLVVLGVVLVSATVVSGFDAVLTWLVKTLINLGV